MSQQQPDADTPQYIFVGQCSDERKWAEHLIRVWPDGSATIAHRVFGGRWGPPRPLEPRPVE